MRVLPWVALFAMIGSAQANEGSPHPVLGAPRITAVRSEQIVGRKRHTYTSVTAHLTGAPLEAAALVVYRVDHAFHRVALSSAEVVAYDDEIEIYLEATSTRSTDEPRPGDHLVFAWRDIAGKLSPLSGELVVTTATQP